MTASGDSGVAQAPCPFPVQSYTCVSDDANAHAGNLRGWSQLYDQISAGSFNGEIQGACFGSLHLFREFTNMRLRQSCMVRADAWWFGIPVREDDSFRLDERRMDRGVIALRRGQQPFELVTPQGFDIFGLVVQRATLERYLQALNCGHVPQRGDDSLRAGGDACARLRHLLREALNELHRQPNLLQNGKAIQAMEHCLLDAIAQVYIGSNECEKAGRTAVQQSLLVRNVRQYLLSLENRVATIPELCSLFAVSRRTLQYAFEEVLGMGPNAYLKLLRLNGVRRDLTRRSGGEKSVQQVASDWGFWHLSQFAKDYRQHFHELPSVTLKRSMDSRSR